MSSQNVAAQEFGVTLFWDPVTAPPGLCHEGGMRKKERNVGTLKHGCSTARRPGQPVSDRVVRELVDLTPRSCPVVGLTCCNNAPFCI